MSRIKKLLFFFCLILPMISQVEAKWGLDPDLIVDSCQTKAVGPCEDFRGRSNQTNGSGSVVIWKVGTKRIVSWGAATKAANAVIEDKMDFSHTLYANFSACPMEKDIPGNRISYCIESIKNIRWEKKDY